MAHKHLSELLSEDQEPFVLQNYIEERRCQLKRSVPRDHLQVKRRKPISGNSTFPASFCKNACFFSFHDSPDVRKSPLFEFSSPLKSPCGNSNKLFVHIPSRTAALLLEAAIRIQKQPSSSKPQTTGKILGSGFFGSMLKRISLCKGNQKPQIKGKEIRASVKDILRWDSSDGHKAFAKERRHDPEKMEALDKNRVVSEMGLSCSCNSGLSSLWSESNEDKSEDLDTSSSRSDEEFCSSPFRFSLRKSPSHGQQTPEFGSPATSPRRHIKKVKQKEEGEEKEGRRESCMGDKEYEEEKKEQCSPVCVLDPAFDTDVEDDDNEGGENNSNDGDHRHLQSDSDCDGDEEGEHVVAAHHHHHHHRQFEEMEEEDSYDEDAVERSFAIVQRAKQQLLNKLRRFERLADLNPIELEKRMLEVEDCDDSYGLVSPDVDDEDDEDDEDGFDESVYSQMKGMGKTPGDMKRLILDLIMEEERRRNEENIDGVDKEVVFNNVGKRLEAWNGVESDTIDMMVELELRREGDEWKRCEEQAREMAIEIEFAIFGLLLQELSDEVHSAS